jgi:hypothetical protein
MIKNRKMRISVDPRGKITTGTKSDKGYPQSLEYFNLESFPELQEAYGDKPMELIVFFPANEIEDFFDDQYALWGSNNAKVRSCDGESCIHRIDEEVDDVKYAAGEETECICRALIDDHKKRCKYDMYLKAYVVDPATMRVKIPLPYLFLSHSSNTGDNIYSALKSFLEIPGASLRGIPFKLTVKMVKGTGKSKFPIWNLYPYTFQKLIGGMAGQPASIESGESENGIDKLQSETYDAALKAINAAKKEETLDKKKDAVSDRFNEGKLTQGQAEELYNLIAKRRNELQGLPF